MFVSFDMTGGLALYFEKSVLQPLLSRAWKAEENFLKVRTSVSQYLIQNWNTQLTYSAVDVKSIIHLNDPRLGWLGPGYRPSLQGRAHAQGVGGALLGRDHDPLLASTSGLTAGSASRLLVTRTWVAGELEREDFRAKKFIQELLQCKKRRDYNI